MKIRILSDTLRLRLTMSETAALGRGESVLETTVFPGDGQLSYGLIVGGEKPSARIFSDGACQRIEVTVPATMAGHWSTSDEVALGGEDGIQLDPLLVLIEKDFDCVSPRSSEEDLDTFPNPKYC